MIEFMWLTSVVLAATALIIGIVGTALALSYHSSIWAAICVVLGLGSALACALLVRYITKLLEE